MCRELKAGNSLRKNEKFTNEVVARLNEPRTHFMAEHISNALLRKSEEIIEAGFKKGLQKEDSRFKDVILRLPKTSGELGRQREFKVGMALARLN